MMSTQASDEAGASTLRTNLIIHQGVADILSQVTKPIHILDAIQEPRDLTPLFQRDEILENIAQFPSEVCTSG